MTRSTDTGPTPLTLHGAAGDDQGLVRDTMQDVALVTPGLLVVADGFGPSGAQAADAAARTVADRLDGPGDVLARLQDAVLAAERAVLDRLATAGPAGSTSGTTVTALAVDGARAATAHVGDGRLYLLRDGVLTRLTADHTHVAMLVETGRLTAEEAAHSTDHQLIRALHVDAPGRPDTASLGVRVGDRLLVVTDGVHRVLDEGVLGEVLAGAVTPQDTVSELVARVRAAGAPDNLGVAVGYLAAG